MERLDHRYNEDGSENIRLAQSCLWVYFFQPNSAQTTKRLIQPNPTYRKIKTLVPQTNPTHNP